MMMKTMMMMMMVVTTMKMTKDGEEEDFRHLPHIDHLKVKLDHKHTGEKFNNETL